MIGERSPSTAKIPTGCLLLFVKEGEFHGRRQPVGRSTCARPRSRQASSRLMTTPDSAGTTFDTAWRLSLAQTAFTLRSFRQCFVTRNSRPPLATFIPSIADSFKPKGCTWMQSKSEGSAKNLRVSGDLGLNLGLEKEEENLYLTQNNGRPVGTRTPDLYRVKVSPRLSVSSI